MLFQFYVVEIKQFADGSYEHTVTWHWDSDADTAQIKAEAKFHSIFADEDNFKGKMHSAILFSTEGFPVRHECYKHEVSAPVAEEMPEE